MIPVADLRITTTCGMSVSTVGAQALRRLLPDLKIVAAQPVPEDERIIPTWIPDFRSRFADFVDRHGAKSDVITEEQCVVESTLDLLRNSEPDSVDILALGPLTNVCRWLEADGALVQSRVNSIWILGGNHPESDESVSSSFEGGAAATSIEFNFGQDPKAAAAVLQSQHVSGKLRIVPGSETHHSRVDDAYMDLIVAAALRAKNNDDDDLLSQTIRADPQYAAFFDPICCFLYDQPQAATFEIKDVDVCRTTGRVRRGKQPHQMASRIDLERYRDWLLARLLMPTTTTTNVAS